MATRDAAAYYQRGGVSKQQAANSTVTRIAGAASRARAEKWSVSCYKRPWTLPLTAIGEAFFTTGMWQGDMVSVVRRDAAPPRHAWAAAGAVEQGGGAQSEAGEEERDDA